MLKLKKIIASAMALALVGSAVPMTASAAYDNCDVNRDGAVSVRDIAALQRYLDGVEYVANYNNYDANKSLTVDQSDLEFVTSKVLGRVHTSYYFSRETNSGVNFPTVSGFTPDYSIDMADHLKFLKYSFELNVTSEYTLTPIEAMPTDELGINARSALAENEKYPSSGAENDGMVLIEGMGTGFIVDDHHIATAAHCVYDSGESQWRYNVNKTPTIKTYNADGTPSEDTLQAVEMHIPKNFDLYKGPGNRQGIYDYALITVKEDLSDHLQFSLGTSYNLSEEDFDGVPIYLTGCPSRIPATNIQNSTKQLYTCQGSIYDRLDEPDDGDGIAFIYWLYNNIAIIDGDSGSPLYTITRNVINGQRSYVYTALAIAGGIHKGNYGPLITKYQLKFYKNNPNAIYTISE